MRSRFLWSAEFLIHSIPSHSKIYPRWFGRWFFRSSHFFGCSKNILVWTFANNTFRIWRGFILPNIGVTCLSFWQATIGWALFHCSMGSQSRPKCECWRLGHFSYLHCIAYLCWFDSRYSQNYSAAINAFSLPRASNWSKYVIVFDKPCRNSTFGSQSRNCFAFVISGHLWSGSSLGKFR